MAKEIWCEKLDQYVDSSYCHDRCLNGIKNADGEIECTLDE